MSNLAKNYNRKKISFKRGRGSYLYSTDGKKYLDFVSGIAVNSLYCIFTRANTVQDIYDVSYSIS